MNSSRHGGFSPPMEGRWLTSIIAELSQSKTCLYAGEALLAQASAPGRILKGWKKLTDVKAPHHDSSERGGNGYGESGAQGPLLVACRRALAGQCPRNVSAGCAARTH